MALWHFITDHLFIGGFLLVLGWYVRRVFRQAPTHEATTALSEQEYGTPCRTIRGERVRSMAECFIANYLNTCGVEYVYETPFLIKAGKGRVRVCPDFYLPEFDLLVEYWGLLNCKPDYEQDMRRKMSHYHQNRIQFISIYPTNLLYPFDPVNFDKLFRYKFQQTTGTALRPLEPKGLTTMRQFQVIRRLESSRPKHSVPK